LRSLVFFIAGVLKLIKAKLFSSYFYQEPKQEIPNPKPVRIEQVEIMKAVAKNKSLKISLANPEHSKIISSILELYGYPISSESCITKQEKIMYVFGLMAVSQGLQRVESLTVRLIEGELTDVELLCREYYDVYGHHIIPTDKEVESPEVFSLLKTGGETTKLELPHPKKEN